MFFLLTAVQKLQKSNEFLPINDHKCRPTVTFYESSYKVVYLRFQVVHIHKIVIRRLGLALVNLYRLTTCRPKVSISAVTTIGTATQEVDNGVLLGRYR